MPNVVITSAGLAALVNAENNGTLPVKITKFGLGTGNYTPSADQTALQSKFKEITALSGGDVGDNTIHVTMSDTSSDAYTVNEVGVYLEDGTLFAVSSQPTGAILQKAAGSQGLLSVDLVISGGTSGITVDGDTNFFNPPATTQVAGVVKLASLDEIKTGTNSSKAVTPSGVFNFVKTYVTEAIEALKTLLRKEIAAAALAAVPIGSCIFYLGTEIPDGFLLMNGASVAKADFDGLYEVIGDKFGNVDSDHFNLPDTHHRFLEGTTNIAEVGGYISAGLPNIKGRMSHTAANGPEASGEGALYYPMKFITRTAWVDNNTEQIPADIALDASRSSPIYVNDLSEVRVNALYGLHLIRAYQC